MIEAENFLNWFGKGQLNSECQPKITKISTLEVD